MRPAEQGRNRRRWLPSNQVTGDGLASRPGRTRRPPRNRMATTVGGAGRAGGQLPPGRL